MYHVLLWCRKRGGGTLINIAQWRKTIRYEPGAYPKCRLPTPAPAPAPAALHINAIERRRQTYDAFMPTNLPSFFIFPRQIPEGGAESDRFFSV